MKTLVLLCGSLLALIPALGSAVSFAAPMAGGWVFEEESAACVLRRVVPGYGTVEFVGKPGEALSFVVRAHRDLFAPGDIQAFVRAPEWHPNYPLERRRGALEHVSGGAAVVSDPVATALMMDLKSGYLLHLGSQPWFAAMTPHAVQLQVSPVRFAAGYDAFAACFEWLMPANYEDVARVRITFPPNGSELGIEAREHLALIARYAIADPTVVKIYVDGHTDNTGDEYRNLRLSQSRAGRVRQVLLDAGAPKNKIVSRYHAARYPMASNDEAAGRALNRRVTVRLERTTDSDPVQVVTTTPPPSEMSAKGY